MEVEQLSFFSMLAPALPAVAVCCMDGNRADAAPAESWMKHLVQGGEYVVQVAGHSLVLRPADRRTPLLVWMLQTIRRTMQLLLVV